MKKIALTLFAVIISAAIFAQAKSAEELVKFAQTKHNFGKIKQGVPVNYNFEFTNVSSQPVVIQKASASCGCTTPTWPQQPVAGGKTNKITAGFNAAAPGPFDKTVFVTVAGVDKPVELRISGEVLKAEDYAKFEAEKDKKGSK
ncbi:DUF1573 domain-containing protein [Flavihumibacter sp. ZG627]|uniref:DUF1573 domain-containing protein n=1 Tax=Flavihumibacter sp. ZG627 TaxID=1463156 RepID=UPI00057C7C2B|nr:DUF1573 domain-containing protein [Flavihumibacter sp. ZG627]KIC89476.1 hypothetical protein HY58_16565 [Flavihumibacter sp. ZG627]